MVYRGRPSKACARCRARRLKCDLSQPGCRKCLNAHVVCAGYRDEQNLLFQNQTDEIIHKHSHSLAKQASPLTTSYECMPLYINHLSLVKDPERRQGVSTVDAGTLDVAVAFLLQRYLRGSSFEWVPQLYSDPSCSSIFAEIVRATALAAYSHECRRHGLLVRARIMYSHALLGMRDAIEHEEESTTISTWASVLLMSRFETLSYDGNEDSIAENWANHVAGAFAIMKARGQAHIQKHALSGALMEQTVHNYNLYCLRARTRRPQSLILAAKELLDLTDEWESSPLGELRLDFHDFSDAFGEFRRLQEICGAADPLDLIRRAQRMDGELVQFQHRLSAVSSYEKLPTTELKRKGRAKWVDFRPYLDVYHVYRSPREARLWNGIRMLRITLCESIHLYASQLHAQEVSSESNLLDVTALEDLMATSALAVKELVLEICASAPQFLRVGVSDCTHAAACFLAWPLFVAGRVVTGPIRDLVSELLLWIAFELNIQSARIAADCLYGDEYRDGYLHACYMF